MSNRERWIVYPLLFFALVMGFKSTYQNPMEFKCRSIECQNLRVGSINGSAAIALMRSPAPQDVTVVRRDDVGAPVADDSDAPDVDSAVEREEGATNTVDEVEETDST